MGKHSELSKHWFRADLVVEPVRGEKRDRRQELLIELASITEIVSEQNKVVGINGLEVRSELRPEELIAAKMLQQNESQSELLNKLGE